MLQSTDFPGLSLRQKLAVLGIPRSGYYYRAAESSDADLANIIYECWQETPIYGYRKITVALREQGLQVNHKRVQRLMQEMDLKEVSQNIIEQRESFNLRG